MIKEENRIYTIKQGDTLQSIADQLQINVDDIIEFHNRHSNIFITESRPNLFGVDIIILSADLSEFRRRHNPNRLNLLYGDITLACEDIVIDEATELQMRGQNLIQAQTIQRFSVK
ncbi:LysM peptidoglycan-binding domain-containing protein [Prevotella jejuni]|uniref:LysM peptidoglycan-binding domain-containing protein n=1 Tax=Prevotella jejuni TaxID=1177574 RepID=UPI002012B830|nr:LysM domain-containing protein [Prevotella jejuni]